MFKKIGKTFEIKKQVFIKTQTDANVTKKALRPFFESIFKDETGLFIESVNYDRSKKTLEIKTKTKTVANEITLRLEEIQKILNKNGIKPARILVR